MYYVFIQDWINTFSRKQMHFVRLETYTKIKKNVTNDIFNFLEIGLFSVCYIQVLISLDTCFIVTTINYLLHIVSMLLTVHTLCKP